VVADGQGGHAEGFRTRNGGLHPARAVENRTIVWFSEA
jgi:hypothetical protein